MNKYEKLVDRLAGCICPDDIDLENQCGPCYGPPHKQRKECWDKALEGIEEE